ncbi:O-linked N-acetylglucosamine transferase, SPINDLY family protein [Herbaspirillum rubrisubalbicans]|uniref:O-linked N-acetylglucosamine transferase, SPINDLY family protein n=1 Tax=Herbaspirillum rubrisubalbicans TaxID=80842 RepID=UPI0021AC7C10|nr:hypothetical protein [Herbaspirillum rubrisubalbicans]
MLLSVETLLHPCKKLSMESNSLTKNEFISNALQAHEQLNFQKAILFCFRYLTIDTNDIDTLRLLGGIALDAGELGLAQFSLEHALQLGGAHSGTLYNLALFWQRKNCNDTAIEFLEKAITIDPLNRDILANLRQSLHARSVLRLSGIAFDAAYQDLMRLLELDPRDHQALYNLGALHLATNQADKAVSFFEKAIEETTTPLPYMSNLLHARMRSCAWSGLDKIINDIELNLDAGMPSSTPMHYLSVTDDPIRQKKLAHLWAPVSPTITWHPESPSEGKRIRVGYFSHDFRIHPVSIMLAGLFEQHDRGAFESFAFATHPGHDFYRKRIENSVEHFLDVSSLDDDELVILARRHQLDVAIDITGLTQGGRSTAFAQRMAPIQMQYLGYPGTSSIPNMDYIIVDQYISQGTARDNYSEYLALLPKTFQISDDLRPSPALDVSRSSLGIPEDGMLFGCLCNTYKFNPRLFDIWMDILGATPSSMLLLYAPTQAAEDNLKTQAAQRNVEPSRLYFSGRVDLPVYFARLGIIDLFLDTYPYNGGTTANDALWMGVPLLTCSGKSFASRMAGSLLHAVGLDEMITNSLAEYRDRAIQLANASDELQEIRETLKQHRLCPNGIFSTSHGVRMLESILNLAVNRHRSGSPLSDIGID